MRPREAWADLGPRMKAAGAEYHKLNRGKCASHHAKARKGAHAMCLACAFGHSRQSRVGLCFFLERPPPTHTNPAPSLTLRRVCVLYI